MAKPKKSASPVSPAAAKPRAKKSAKKPESAPVAAPAKAKPTPEAIGARAHAIWVAEGRPEGKSIEHWLRAERELNS